MGGERPFAAARTNDRSADKEAIRDEFRKVSFRPLSSITVCLVSDNRNEKGPLKGPDQIALSFSIELKAKLVVRAQAHIAHAFLHFTSVHIYAQITAAQIDTKTGPDAWREKALITRKHAIV